MGAAWTRERVFAVAALARPVVRTVAGRVTVGVRAYRDPNRLDRVRVGSVCGLTVEQACLLLDWVRAVELQPAGPAAVAA